MLLQLVTQSRARLLSDAGRILEDIDEEFATAEAAKEALRQRWAQEHTTNKRLQARIDRLTQDWNEATARCAHLEGELEEVHARAGRFETERGQVQKKLEEERRARVQTGLQSEKLQEVQTWLSSLETERTNLEVQLAEERSSKDLLQLQMEARLAEERRGRDQLQLELQAQLSKIERCDRLAQEAESQLSTVCSERTELESQLAQAESHLSTVCSERTELEGQLAQAESQLSTVCGERTELESQLAQAESQLSIVCSERTELESQLALERGCRSQLELELEVKIAMYEQQLEACAKSLSQERAAARAAQLKLEKLTEEHKSARDSEARHLEAERRLLDVQGRLARAQADLDVMQQHYDPEAADLDAPLQQLMESRRHVKHVEDRREPSEREVELEKQLGDTLQILRQEQERHVAELSSLSERHTEGEARMQQQLAEALQGLDHAKAAVNGCGRHAGDLEQELAETLQRLRRAEAAAAANASAPLARDLEQQLSDTQQCLRRTEADKERLCRVLEKAAAPGRCCPKGHKVQPIDSPQDGFACDACSAPQRFGSRMFTCWTCTGDFCAICVRGPSAQQEKDERNLLRKELEAERNLLVSLRRELQSLEAPPGERSVDVSSGSPQWHSARGEEAPPPPLRCDLDLSNDSGEVRLLRDRLDTVTEGLERLCSMADQKLQDLPKQLDSQGAGQAEMEWMHGRWQSAGPIWSGRRPAGGGAA